MTLSAWRDRLGWLVFAAVIAATTVSFVMSYRGLLQWAEHHGYSSGWAWVFPLSVDLFIIVGEATLFRAVHDGWGAWEQVPAWCAVSCGLVASVAGNAHIGWDTVIATRITMGVPPVSATAMLALGLVVLKHEVAARAAQQAAQQAEVAAVATVGSGPDRKPRPGRPSPPSLRAASAPQLTTYRAAVPGCPHEVLPRGSRERALAVPGHFRECLHRPARSDRELAEWVGSHRDTVKKHLNGQLAEVR